MEQIGAVYFHFLSFFSPSYGFCCHECNIDWLANEENLVGKIFDFSKQKSEVKIV